MNTRVIVFPIISLLFMGIAFISDCLFLMISSVLISAFFAFYSVHYSCLKDMLLTKGRLNKEIKALEDAVGKTKNEKDELENFKKNLEKEISVLEKNKPENVIRDLEKKNKQLEKQVMDLAKKILDYAGAVDL